MAGETTAMECSCLFSMGDKGNCEQRKLMNTLKRLWYPIGSHVKHRHGWRIIADGDWTVEELDPYDTE